MKIFKIIAINLFILAGVLVASEIAIFNMAEKEYMEMSAKYVPLDEIEPLKYSLKMNPAKEYFFYLLNREKRKPEGVEINKKPIVLFGCSFTYGSALHDNQTFSHKLYELTKRPIYNQAIPSLGIQHMYVQLCDENFYKSIPREPEYIIYTLIDFPVHRLYEYSHFLWDKHLNLRYYPNKFDKNQNLLEKKPFLPKYLNGLYTLKYLEHLNAVRMLEPDKIKQNEDFMFTLFEQSMKQARKHYPNTKFVLIAFDIDANDLDKYNDLFSRLKNIGYIVIKNEDIINVDYSDVKYNISKNDCHPSELYWNLFTPKFVEKLKLK